MILHVLIAMLAGWLQRHQQQVIAYAPINPHKPLVRQRLILSFWLYGYRYYKVYSSLISFKSRSIYHSL
jgi:hypothetical protein